MSVAAKKQASDAIGVDRLLHMYRQMVAIRLFEQRVNDLYIRALIPGLAHLDIEGDPIAARIPRAVQRTGVVTITHTRAGDGHVKG